MRPSAALAALQLRGRARLHPSLALAPRRRRTNFVSIPKQTHSSGLGMWKLRSLNDLARPLAQKRETPDATEKVSALCRYTSINMSMSYRISIYISIHLYVSTCRDAEHTHTCPSMQVRAHVHTLFHARVGTHTHTRLPTQVWLAAVRLPRDTKVLGKKTPRLRSARLSITCTHRVTDAADIQVPETNSNDQRQQVNAP